MLRAIGGGRGGVKMKVENDANKIEGVADGRNQEL